MAKQFVELNTDLDYNGTTYVPELNGRQGDNNREVYFFIKRGVRPFDLSDKTMTLFMKDAVGGVKTASTINDRAGITAGRFSLLIPKEFYQAEGDTQESFLQIKKDDSVLTTIPLAFKVIANGMSVTQSQSTVYIDSVQKILDELAPRIESTTAGVEANQNAMRALTANIEALNQTYNIDLLGKKTQFNEWQENNTFDKDVTVKGNLHANADNAKHADLASTLEPANDQAVNKLDVNGPLFAHGDTAINKLDVNGDTVVNKVDVNGTLLAHGDTAVNKLDVNGPLFAHGALFVDGSVNMTKVREADAWDEGLNAHLIRVGNVVMARLNGGIIKDHPAFTKMLWDIPAGFRPVGETDLLASVGYSKGMIKVFPDGSAWNIDTTFKVKDNNGGDGVPYGFGCWVTTDGFPA